MVEVSPEADVSLDDAFMVADGALYRAKRTRTAGAASIRLSRVELAARGGADPECGERA
jgi:hypothetical protein